MNDYAKALMRAIQTPRPAIEHKEFVRLLKENKIVVDVDRNKAGYLYEEKGLLLEKLRTQQAIIRAIAFGGSIVGIAAFFFAPWWLALAILIAGIATFPHAQRHAAAGVLSECIRSDEVYAFAVANGVIVIR